MIERTFGADAEIDADSIRAVEAIYFAYALEELRLFQVVERLAQLFAEGLLRIGEARTQEALRAVAPGRERLTEADRRALYARALGAPGGAADGATPNREFVSLWLRFVSAVAGHADQHGAANVLAPPTTLNARVRAAARALAANASAHGQALKTAAAKLLAEARAAIELLGSPDVLDAYGARDCWQVIDQVNRNDLGGARNVARYRTQATTGSRILRWLADHADLLDDARAAPHASTPEGDALADAAWQFLRAGDAPAETDSPRSRSQARGRHLLDAVGLEPARGDRGNEVPRAPMVVFHGGRHTGKTLAAYELAQALGKDVYRVDLSQVVGKYIGETEKNLDAVFARAQETDAVLLLDEADALFGRRTEVRDAHDRYANVDVERLLQRKETHAGLVILATNRRDHIDAAFLRRLRFVDFPRPAA